MRKISGYAPDADSEAQRIAELSLRVLDKSIRMARDIKILSSRFLQYLAINDESRLSITIGSARKPSSVRISASPVVIWITKIVIIMATGVQLRYVPKEV